MMWKEDGGKTNEERKQSNFNTFLFFPEDFLSSFQKTLLGFFHVYQQYCEH